MTVVVSAVTGNRKWRRKRLKSPNLGRPPALLDRRAPPRLAMTTVGSAVAGNRKWRRNQLKTPNSGRPPPLLRRPHPSCRARQLSSRRIGRDRLSVKSHGAVYFHHRRRGFLARQGFGFGGAGRAVAGARLHRPPAQARSLSQRRSGHHESDPARRGVRDRRRGGDRPRSRPLRAVHRPQRQPGRTISPPVESTRS